MRLVIVLRVEDILEVARWMDITHFFIMMLYWCNIWAMYKMLLANSSVVMLVGFEIVETYDA